MKSSVQRSLCLLCGMLLSGCASDARERPVREISIADVDVLSPGVIALVQRLGEIDLNDRRVVCEKRKFIGSNMIKMVCLTREEKAAEAEKAEQELALLQDEWERRYDVYRGAQ